MENIEQPNLKGAVFSWASLAGITFSRVATAAGMAFGGQGLSQARTAGALLQRQSPAEGLQLQPWCLGLGSGLSQAPDTSSPGLARVWLGGSQLHPSAQTYPEMREILMGYFE